MKNTRFLLCCLMLLPPVVARADSIAMTMKAMDGFGGSTSFVYNPSEAFDEISCSISATGSASGSFSAWLSASQPAPGASVSVSAELTNYVYSSDAGAQDLKVAEVTVWGSRTDPPETVELAAFDVVMDVPYFAEAINGLTGASLGACALPSLPSPGVCQEIGTPPVISGYLFTGWTGLAVDLGCVRVWSDSTVLLYAYRYFITYGQTTQCRLTANYAVERKLTTSSSAGGSVTVPGEGTYSYGAGSSVTVGAMPEEGYRFSYWTGTAVTAGKIEVLDIGCAEVTMDGDYTMVANFSPTTSTTRMLDVSSGAGGSVTSPGEGSYAYTLGTSVSIAATAETGYEFTGWTGTAVSAGKVADASAMSTTVTMDGDYTVVANFSSTTSTTRTLNISSGAGGSVTSPGEGTFSYAPGTTVSIVATANTNCEFTGWSGTAVSAGKVANPTAASTTVTVDAGYTLVANFSTEGPTYTLTVSSSEGGYVSTPGEGTFTYTPGTSVMLWSKADTGYVFSSWSGTAVDAGRVEEPRSFATRVTVGGNYTLVANFSPRGNYIRELAISSSAGGTVTSPGEGGFGYSEPTTVSLVATAEPDYEFSSWIGTAVNAGKVADPSAASTTVMADGNYTLRANFAPAVSDARVLSISSGEGGSVAAPGEGAVVLEAGVGVRVVALPDPGYVFVGWTGTLVELGGLDDPTIGDIDFVAATDASLHAIFAPALLCLYVDDDGPGDPYPHNRLVSDPAEDGSWEHPFDSVQEAIDIAESGDAILVLPGTYREHLNFQGKDLTVSAFDLYTVGATSQTTLIGTDANSVVVFEGGESSAAVLAGFTILGGGGEAGGGVRCLGADPVIAHCLITGNRADLGGGLYCQQSRATLVNCTVADNFSWLEGGGLHCDDEVTVINSIFSGNRPEQIVADPCQAPCVTYSAVRGGWPGAGNFDGDPRFVEPGHWALSGDTGVLVDPDITEAAWISGDYHLKAREGHWSGWMWLRDGTTSFCVDAGHPSGNVKCEPAPNGDRINMGAFGGTAEASRSDP